MSTTKSISNSQALNSSVHSIEERVKEVLAEKIGINADEIENNQSLKDDLSLTPSDISDVIHELELTFNSDIPDEEIAQLANVQDLIEILEKYGKEF